MSLLICLAGFALLSSLTEFLKGEVTVFLHKTGLDYILSQYFKVVWCKVFTEVAHAELLGWALRGIKFITTQTWFFLLLLVF